VPRDARAARPKVSHRARGCHEIEGLTALRSAERTGRASRRRFGYRLSRSDRGERALRDSGERRAAAASPRCARSAGTRMPGSWVSAKHSKLAPVQKIETPKNGRPFGSVERAHPEANVGIIERDVRVTKREPVHEIVRRSRVANTRGRRSRENSCPSHVGIRDRAAARFGEETLKEHETLRPTIDSLLLFDRTTLLAARGTSRRSSEDGYAKKTGLRFPPHPDQREVAGPKA